MKTLIISFLMIVSSVNAQSLKNEFLNFNVDEENKEYFVKVGDIGNDKSQVEIEIKCFSTLSDYEKNSRTIEILHVNQKINNGGNVFFGGELFEGEYVITLSYVENGKKIKKTQKKVVKNLTN
jgi:hypothetical protein